MVYGFDNGTDALIEVLRIQPDLILLDIMMPDIDGFTLCKRLKTNEKTKDIPVIFLSASNQFVVIHPDPLASELTLGFDWLSQRSELTTHSSD